MILVEDLLTFLGLDYRDASLTTLYLVGCIRSQYSKHQNNRIILTFKNQHVLKGHTDFLVMIIELLRFIRRTSLF